MRLIGRWLLLGLVIVCSLPVSAAGGLAESCAVITDGSEAASRIGALVELDVSRSGAVRVVDREHIAATFAEGELAKVLGPAAGRERAATGRRLRADVLVLIEGQADAKGLTVTVCETKAGLRLANIVVASDDGEGAAERIAGAVRDALTIDARKAIICAVPPFVSADLTTTFIPLSAAYAKLVEAAIVRRGGYVVVELQEARAIANEIAVVGAANPGRSLPLYFEGDYQTTGTDPAARRVSFRLALRRGPKQLATTHRANLEAQAVAAALQDAVADLLAKAKLLVAVPPPGVKSEDDEAAVLAARSAVFRRLGNWSESLALIEASLLIKPDQPAMHRDAAYVITQWLENPIEGNGQFTEALDAQQLIVIGRAGLSHLEAHLRQTRAGVTDLATLNPSIDTDWSVVNPFLKSFHSLAYVADPKRKPGDHSPFATEALEMVRSVLRHKAQQGANDRAMGFLYQAADWTEGTEDVARGFANKLKCAAESSAALGTVDEVVRFFMRDDRARRTAAFVRLEDTPEFRPALDALAAIPAPVCQEAASNIRRRLDLGLSPAGPWPPHPSERAASTQPASPPRWTPDVVAPKPFAPVIRGAKDTPVPVKSLSAIAGWISAGDGIEAVWDRYNLFLMTRRGELQWVTGIGSRGVCFDGKYVWATGPGEALRVLLIDPKTAAIRHFDPSPELMPIYPTERGAKGSRTLMTGLSPGRICIAGAFGRSWVGTIDYREADQSMHYTVLFHARRQPEQQDREDWRHADVAFIPLFMTTLTAPPDTPDGLPVVRVLLGRDGGHAFNRYHPLSIDVEGQKVEVVKDPIRVTSDPYSIYDDGECLYWVDQIDTGTFLYKLGPADLRRHVVATVPFKGSVGRTHRGYVIDSTLSLQRNILSFSRNLVGPYSERQLEGGAVMQMFYSKFHGLVLSDRQSASLVEIDSEAAPPPR